jgi:hypothetical protein
LSQFLLYVCERALTGREDEIREQQIGTAVFGRRSGYNPADDNIVRVGARDLRHRLDLYFDEEGAGEALRISIPKGSYVPLFEPREATFTGATSQGEALDSPEGHVESTEGTPDRSSLWSILAGRRVWIIVAAVVLLAAAAFWGGIGYDRLGRSGGAPGGAKGETAPANFWLSLFDSQRPVTVVLGDASLVIAQDATRQVFSVTDYSDGSYLDKIARVKPEASQFATRPYSSLADAVLTAQLAQAAAAQHRSLVVRYARDLKMRDLEDENLLFIGTAYSDPWLREFDEERNFILGVDPPTRNLYFLNKLPQAGEMPRYNAGGAGHQQNEDYGMVTYLAGPHRANHILAIEGTNSVATEAAGDFITDPYSGAHFAQYLGLPSNTVSFPSFQFLLRVTTLNNTPSKFKVIAHRVSTNSQPPR